MTKDESYPAKERAASGIDRDSDERRRAVTPSDAERFATPTRATFTAAGIHRHH